MSTSWKKLPEAAGISSERPQAGLVIASTQLRRMAPSVSDVVLWVKMCELSLRGCRWHNCCAPGHSEECA